MATVEKLCDPLRLLPLLISVTLTGCTTTTLSPGTSTLTFAAITSADLNGTLTTFPNLASNITAVPGVSLPYATTFAPNASSTFAFTAVPNSFTTSSNATVSPGNSVTSFPTFATSSSDIPPVTQTNASTFAPSAVTGTPSFAPVNVTPTLTPPGPGDSNTNTKPDPLGGLTTPAVTSSQTPRITSGRPQIASQVTPSTNIGTGNRNPYTENLGPQPRPLSPLTPLQQQRLMSPWLFAGSDYFPYLLLMSNQQNNLQRSPNTAANSLPLYLTAMDPDLWPLLLTQARSRQQSPQLVSQPQLRVQPQLSLQQPERQSFANQPQQSQNQQIQTRNNLASWYFLSELY